MVVYSLNAQDQNEINNLRAQLLETKLESLEANLQLFQKNSVRKIKTIDSLIYVLENTDPVIVHEKDKARDTILMKNYTSAISINPARLLEGSLFLSYEKSFSDRFSIDLGLMGTYVTRNGIGGGYLEAQNLDLAAASFVENDLYFDYSGEMMTGWGVFLEGKKYLSPKSEAPFGLYAGPHLMYRKVHFIFRAYKWDTSNYTDAVKNLDVVRAGVILGGKFKFSDVLCLDISVGGIMRLSKYFRDSKFTKYQKWINIDYSGVLPTLTIKLGILN